MIFRNLGKAPINEALIGIRVGSTEVGIPQLDQVLSALPEDYQTPRESVVLSQTQLNLTASGPDIANIERKNLGWRFNTKSKKYAIQARSDCFIFSRLPPYTNWNEFTEEAEKVWQVIAPAYNLASIQTVSVRYINELQLKVAEQVEKYLKFYINVPEGVPQGFVSYFARIQLHHSQDTIATIQSGLLPPLPDRARLMLDIELTKAIVPKDNEELWHAVHSLREPKNQIFFSCITDEWESKLR